MFIENTLEEYISKTSSQAPAPGGGSVAALVGSLGGALTQMAMNLSRNKKSYEDLSLEIREEMELYISDINYYMERLKLIIDEDTKAFNRVLEAYKLDKDDPDRPEEIQAGYREAMNPPLKVIRLSYEILKRQRIFADHGNPNLITDVAIASIMTYAAMESSLFNLKVNLREIEDGDYREEVESEIKKYMEEGQDLRDEILRLVNGRL